MHNARPLTDPSRIVLMHNPPVRFEVDASGRVCVGNSYSVEVVSARHGRAIRVAAAVAGLMLRDAGEDVSPAEHDRLVELV